MLEFGSTHVLHAAAGGAAAGPTEGNPNVVLASLGALQEAVVPCGSAGVACKACGGHLNTLSSVVSDGDVHVWTCDFCSVGQTVDVTAVPTGNPVVWESQAAPEAPEGAGGAAADHVTDDGIVVFCVDVSGSMGMTTEVTGTWSLPGKEPKRDLLGGTKDTCYVSRLEFVQSAIVQQLTAMVASGGSQRVGLVTFSTDIKVYGDGTAPKPHVINDDVDFDALKALGGQLPIRGCIKDTIGRVEELVLMLQPGGVTALGPALATSVAMCGQRPGSRVVLCTDGVANRGIGNLESKGDTFYTSLADYACEMGVVVNVVSIKGQDTKMEMLGGVADRTHGAVELLDAEKLDFGSSVQAAAIATAVELTVQVSNVLKFNREDGGRGPSVATRPVGIATADTQACLEIEFTTPLEPGAEETSVKEVTLQARCAYHTRSGAHREHVHTIRMPVTADRAVVEQSMDIAVISANLAQQCAVIARSGEYEAALGMAKQVKAMVDRCLGHNLNEDKVKELHAMFEEEFNKISAQLGSTIQRERQAGGVWDEGARRDARDDDTSAMLYNYHGSNKGACTIQ